MECNSVCLGIKQFFGDLLSEVTLLVAIVISAVIATRIAISVYRDIRSKVREKQMLRLGSEIQELVRAIVREYPSPPLTSEIIPQRFPSKGAAQVFGERWSRGDLNSFSTKSVDADGYDENHPKFDNTSIRSLLLFCTR
jgi:type II secretory pathway pseudopilin PulG